MTVLWILSALLALLILLALLRVGVRLTFGRGQKRLIVKIGFLTVPSKKKKPRKEQETEPTEETKKKKSSFKPTFSEIQSAVPALFTALKRGLRQTRRRLRIDPMRLSVTLAGENPARVAEMYGWAESAMWTLMPRLEELVRMPDPRIHLDVDYQARQIRAEGEIGLSLRVGDAVIIGLAFGIPLLRWYRDVKKKRETAQTQKTNTSTVKENEHGHE